MATKHNPLLLSVIFLLVGWGLEVSGIANLPLAIALWIIAGVFFLWWLWHFLPEKPFQRKFMGPLVLIGFGVLCIIAGGVWYFNVAARVNASTPLSIINPGPELIRTTLIQNHKGEKTVYKNIHLIGVRNDSINQKTIKGIELKVTITGVLGNLRLLNSNQTITDLNPGDEALFEVGYLYSTDRVTMPSGSDKLSETDFKYALSRAIDEMFVFDLGSDEGKYNISVEQLKDGVADDAPYINAQFTAADNPPLRLKITARFDDAYGVLLNAETQD